MMDSSENDIDLVLTALRETQPPSGFEQRLMATVEQAREQSPRRRAWFCPIAVAGACTALLLGHVLLQTKPLPPAAPTVAHSTALEAPAAQIATVAAPASRAIAVPSRCCSATENQAPLLHEATAPVSSDDQLAQEQTVAASHPAPPIPLTREERLLLRSSRRNDQLTVAQLETLPRPPLSRDAAVTQYVGRNLAALATAESFHRTEPVTVPAEMPQAQPEQPDETPQ